MRKYASSNMSITETMDNIGSNGTIIPADITKAIIGTAYEYLTNFRNTKHETWTDSKENRVIVFPANAHQVLIALEIDAHD